MLHLPVEDLAFFIEINMKTKEEKQKALAELDGFTGTVIYHRYSPQLFPNVVLTDGVRFLAETADCFWLMDAIAALQAHPTIRQHPRLQEGMQFWRLRVEEDESAILFCEWDTGKSVYDQKIDWTDFPLPEQRIWVSKEGNLIVLMLLSEY